MNPATRHLSAPACAPTGSATVYPILFMVSTAHLLNDMMQSVIPAVYPLLKDNFGFTFTQIGIITLVFQMTSSLLQPLMGRYADLHPRPYSLAVGMCFTLTGLLTLATAHGFGLGDFVFMVREDQILSACMDIDGLAKVFLGHLGALDMPAWTALAPRRLPVRLSFFFRLPQHKIQRIFLLILTRY